MKKSLFYKIHFCLLVYVSLSTQALVGSEPIHGANFGNVHAVPKSFIYGYNNSLVIAQAMNAIYDEIAFNSFEDNSTGNWVFNSGGIQTESGKKSITGNKYYTLTAGSITKSFSVSPGKNMIVSYWSRSGIQNVNGSGSAQTGRSVPIDGYTWTYYEHVISNPSSITVSGSAIIDELRLYPEDAAMTTYTYDPLIGILSQCEPNNQITYNEYDIFNRLSIIRDLDNKVVKKYCYGSAGLTEDCSGQIFYSIVKSGLFTRSDCDAGYNGSSVTYTVPYGTYVSADQNEVNQLAQSDYDEYGPIYANINGTCILPPPPPPMATINGYNYTSAPFNLMLYNYSSGLTYNFNLPANTYSTITLGQVPQSTYRVTFYPASGAGISATFGINGFSSYGTGALFHNVPILTTSTAAIY